MVQCNSLCSFSNMIDGAGTDRRASYFSQKPDFCGASAFINEQRARREQRGAGRGLYF